MKKILLLLTGISSLMMANVVNEKSEVSTELMYKRKLEKGNYNYLQSNTVARVKLPLDFELNTNLEFYSGFKGDNFIVSEKNTGVEVLKGFGKYGKIGLGAKLDKTVRLRYLNEHKFDKNNKIYGGVELQKKLINQKEMLRSAYEYEGINHSQKLNYDLMTNTAKVYLGGEHKGEIKEGTYKASTELSNTIQYDKVKTDYAPNSFWRRATVKETVEKSLFSNQIETVLKGEFTFKEVPFTFSGESKTNLFIGKFDGDIKQDILDFQTSLVTSISYKYQKDKFTVKPELKVTNSLNHNNTLKHDVLKPIPDGFNIDAEVKTNSYQLSLLETVDLEYEIKDGFSVYSKLGFGSEFYTYRKKLNEKVMEVPALVAPFKMERLESKFKHTNSSFLLRFGLKYSW